MSEGLSVPVAEQLVDELVQSFSGFVNHQLIQESAKHEYVWTQVDPSLAVPVLNESTLKA